MSRKQKFGDDARLALKQGVDIVYKAVAPSLGPKGRSALLSYGKGASIILDDGVAIAASIEDSDPFVDEGISLLRSISLKTNTVSGDGCQPYDEVILTPKGWVTFANIKENDEIFGSDGDTQLVLKVYDKEARDIYAVHFSNGSVVHCSLDHMWTVYDFKQKQLRNMKLEELIAEGSKVGYKYFGTPVLNCLNYAERDIPMSAYMLGLYIGNGHQDKNRVFIDSPKQAIVDYIVNSYNNVKQYKHDGCTRIALNFSDNPELLYLKENYVQCKALTKFIPELYKYNSLAVREALYQGLMDTDGSKDGSTFYTSSSQLARDFHELTMSLGYNTRLYIRDRRAAAPHPNKYGKLIYNKGIAYEIDHRKAAFITITDIVKTERHEPVRCIKVSNPDELYITSGYILTHNTTTSMVLAKNLLDNGIKNVVAGAKPTLIKRGIEVAVDICGKFLDKVSTKVSTKEDLEKVATISSNDKEMGKLVAEAVYTVGSNGIVSAERGDTLGLNLEIVDGLQIGSGYIHPYFGLNTADKKVELNKPLIAVIDRQLQYSSEIKALLEYTVAQARSLLIICDNMTATALQTVLLNYTKNNMPICVIKSPSGGANKKEILDDISLYTGAKIFGSTTGDSMAKWTPELLGEAERVIVEENTTVIRGAKDKELLKERVAVIDKELAICRDAARKEHLSLRKAGLTTGIALLKILCPTEEETNQRMAKLEDAKNAAKAALEGGIIPGGGTTLVRCMDELDNYLLAHPTIPEDVRAGINIVKNALSKPVEVIAENTGYNGEVIFNEVKKGDFNYGFDADKENFCDMIKAGIFDATKVIKTALQNACSVVGTVLMIETVSVNGNDEDIKTTK